MKPGFQIRRISLKDESKAFYRIEIMKTKVRDFLISTLPTSRRGQDTNGFGPDIML